VSTNYVCNKPPEDSSANGVSPIPIPNDPAIPWRDGIGRPGRDERDAIVGGYRGRIIRPEMLVGETDLAARDNELRLGEGLGEFEYLILIHGAPTGSRVEIPVTARSGRHSTKVQWGGEATGLKRGRRSGGRSLTSRSWMSLITGAASAK
jgi:hypothetical protein